MAVLGKKGLFGLGSSLGGRGLISTPSNRALRAIFDGEGDLEATISQIASMSATFDGEGEAEGTLSTISSLSADFDGEGDVEGTITAGAFEFSNALEFDGTNDYVSLMGTNAIKSSQPFSISFWLKPVDLDARLAQFSTDAGRGFFIGLLTATNYKDLYFSCQDGALTDVSYSFTLGTWYHIVITYNGLGFSTRANYKCYINAISQTLNGSANFSSVATEVQIGAQFGIATGAKTMDEWYYWDNYELTPLDVANLYNGGSGDFASVVPSAPTFELRMNGTSGDSTAIDDSGNGNTGTLNNFDTSTCWVAHLPYNGSDADANAYINAAEITDLSEIAAIEQLFSDLKGTGSTTNNSNIYSKFVALYPMSPTSLAAAAVNAVNPSTYDYTWFNSPTHSASGVSFNGSTQYGDSGMIPSANFTDYDFAQTLSFSSANYNNGYPTGAVGGNVLTRFRNTPRFENQVGGITLTDSGANNGVYIGSTRSTTDSELYFNGVSQASSGATTSASPSTLSLYLGGFNSSGTMAGPANFTCDFNAYSTGLTDNEAQDLYDAINTYNTALGR